MESNVHSYQLTQKNKVYILTTSILGNDIKISVKDKAGTMAFSRTYTIETWKKIGAVFESIQNAQDAIQWINKTLKTHKVKVIEAGNMVKIIFFIVENRTKHLVEIPISEGGQINAALGTSSTTLSSTAVVSSTVDTSSFATSGAVESANIDTTAFNTGAVESANIDTTAFNTGSVENTNIDATALNTGAVESANIDATAFNTGDVVSSNVQATSYDAGAMMEASQYMQQGATATTTTTTTEVNFSREIGLDPSKIVKQTVNPNTQEIINSIEEEKKLRLSQVGKVINEPSQSGAFEEASQFQSTQIQIPEQTTENFITQSIDLPATSTIPETTSQINFQEYQTSTTPIISGQFTETNTQISNVAQASSTTQNYSLPYITPADEQVQTVNTEIKAEAAPVEMNFEQNFNNEVNYDQFQTTETATTTTTTQFDTQNMVQDDRLVKLEGDTNSLKNEHQEIQAKLSTLLNQVNSYKSQVELLEREKNSRELSDLRAENAAIKQQLSELNNLRREAAEVQMLRSQVSQIDPLRRKAAELDSLRGQLN